MKTRRVVCAANRHMETGVIVCGARHFDDLMRQAIRAMNDGDWDTSWNCAEEGFVDNFGNFLTRNEAMVMARKNGQILYDAGWSKTDLYSENLY